MPILIKDYRWTETEKIVYITVPLKGVKGSKADIFCTREFIKVSFPPFLFEALLFASIDDDKSVATIKDGCVVFTLIKEEEKIWTKLVSPSSGDKSYVLKKKQEAIDYAQKKSEELQKEKSAIKEKQKKLTLKEMMKLEEIDRTRIEEVKESERLQTTMELDEWKERKRAENERERIELLEIYRAKLLRENNESQDTCKITEIFDESPETENIFEEAQGSPSSNASIAAEEAPVLNDVTPNHRHQTNPPRHSKKPVRGQSGPRKAGKIAVNFTPRVFPTPQRESKEAEENEWLQKQSQARKQFAIDEPDLAEHEKDPVWLKDKGGQLFASGDYLAAVNAYNLAIKIQPGMPILYLNRAACHLKLRNLYKCAEDCSTALDMMVPKVDANAKGRLKAHLRRAAAFSELELYVEALQDYEAALKIDPKNEKLKGDADKLRSVIQSSDG